MHTGATEPRPVISPAPSPSSLPRCSAGRRTSFKFQFLLKSPGLAFLNHLQLSSNNGKVRTEAPCLWNRSACEMPAGTFRREASPSLLPPSQNARSQLDRARGLAFSTLYLWPCASRHARGMLGRTNKICPGVFGVFLEFVPDYWPLSQISAVRV